MQHGLAAKVTIVGLCFGQQKQHAHHRQDLFHVALPGPFLTSTAGGGAFPRGHGGAHGHQPKQQPPTAELNAHVGRRIVHDRVNPSHHFLVHVHDDANALV